MVPIKLRAVPVREVAEGDIVFSRQMLGAAAGTAQIGASRFVVPPLARQMPVHVHGDEEEIFFVLAGGGLSWQRDGACAIGPGDTIVQPPRGPPHTFLAGAEGLELVAFGSGSATSITYLPRARVMWCGPRWVPVDSPHPFRAEAEAGPLERPGPVPRPANVIALPEVDPGAFPAAEVRAVGAAGGSAQAGLNHVRLAPGSSGPPPHCHALEEELFVMLEGAGALALGDAEHPLAAGDVVARPPGTGVAHAITAGEAGLTYLAYGTRVPGDSVYYPEAGQVRLRGLGVTLDVAR
ncbi:MAG: cupin domain-containing protein [Solirubrobacteraceae bacterium]